MSADRVFVDTNIVLSGLLYKKGNEAGILRMALTGDLRLVLADAVIAEVRGVLRNRFPDEQAEFEDYLSRVQYEPVPYPDDAELEGVPAVVRDPKDIPVLASILASQPDVALTGDKDLLTDEVRAIAPTCRCADYLEKRRD